MPEYTITVTKTARKQLDKLADDIAGPLLTAIGRLVHDPRPPGCKKLKGRDSYRIRQGDYRIIYDIYDKVLTVNVVTVGNRRDVYE